MTLYAENGLRVVVHPDQRMSETSTWVDVTCPEGSETGVSTWFVPVPVRAQETGQGNQGVTGNHEHCNRSGGKTST